MQTKTSVNISIVGCGATGASEVIALVSQFLKYNISGINIHIFEPNELGLGVAYSSDKKLLLNTSICSTTIVNGDPLHFYNWLISHEKEWEKDYKNIKEYDATSFMPRALAGTYIQSSLNDYIKLAKKGGIKIKHYKERVDEVYKIKNGNYVIKTKHSKIVSDFCIICTGYIEPYAQRYGFLSENKNYIGSPYRNLSIINDNKKNKRILIIGTSLSAIDAVRLINNKHNIVMASRHGHLPSVRNEFLSQIPKHLTENNINKILSEKNLKLDLVIREIEREFTMLYGRSIKFSNILIKSNALEQLLDDIKQAENNECVWVKGLISAIGMIDKAWPLLSLTDKKNLIVENIPLFHRYLASIPLQVGQEIAERIASGKVKIKSELQEVRIEENKFVAKFLEKDGPAEYVFDYVINATSQEKNLKMIPNSLYSKMHEDGLLSLNHYGGIIVDDEFHVSCKNVSANNHLYAAGPITHGDILVTNMLDACAKQAAIIAKSVARSIATGS